MEFRILGPLEVLDEGRAIALPGSRQRALLALLLLHANEMVTTDRLIDDLWGERPPAGAAKSLQMQISRLRKALAGEAEVGSDGVVVTRGRGYELRLDPDCIDAHCFERLVAEGRSELADGDPARAASVLEEALSLWRGEPLAELGYEPFAQREIARLDDLRLAALEQLVDAKLALGGHAEVVGQLESSIDEHPFREHLRAQLMLALYRCDRQADALQAYQDARRTLVEQLGIEPGEQLRELERAILAQDAGLAWVAADRPAVAERATDRARRAFVGRERELAELAAGLDDAFAGRGRLFLLVGEPGIGKSCLAEELIALARARGARILRGRCWEAGGAPAYWPWVQSLRACARESDDSALRSQLGAGAAELAQIVPELRERFRDLPEPPSSEPEAARFRLFNATAEFLRNASVGQPLVLFLDDLHAADAPSLLLLRFVARELDSTRVLLLGAYRDVDPVPGQPLTEMLVEVAREPVTRCLALGGLSELEVAQYVELTASEIAWRELAGGLHAETEGNPLFVGEIVRLLAVEGVQSDAAADARFALPQSIRDVIARRLSHLSAESERMLVLASVIGREFALDTLARMGDVSENELLENLDEALAARVLSDLPDGTGRLRFAHVLIRDTLYDGLTSARRVRLHRLVVDALEALYGDQPGPHLAELAHHSVAGRDFDKGVRYAWRAADRALALLAYEEAARLYRMALETLEHTHPIDEQIHSELLLGVGEAEARAGNTPGAKVAFLQAARLARQLGLPRKLARAAAGYGGRIVWARAGDDDRLIPLLEEALAALAEEDVELRARLLARLAGALRDEHLRDRRYALSGEAVELARSTGNTAALAYALDGRAAVIVGPDTIAECLALGSELCEVAERIGDTERVAAGLSHRIIAQLQVGDVRGAEADLTAARRIAEELRQPAQLWQQCASRAMLALAAGRLSEAEELVAQAWALGERAQPTAATPVYRLHRYTLCDFRDRLEEVEPEMRQLAAEYPARVVFRCALALLNARLARPREAQRALDELAGNDVSALPFDQEWLYGMSLLAETATLLGDTRGARVLYRRLLPWAPLNVADVGEGIRGSVSRYLGLLATRMQSWEQAELHFEHALEMNTRMGVRPWLAHTEKDYATMLRARHGRGDRERAQALLDAASTTYRELGMASYAEAVAAPDARHR
jgi:DNA-binding SARP family transcriptional activator/tetratricopeptide (TPR) repeat protein